MTGQNVSRRILCAIALGCLAHSSGAAAQTLDAIMACRQVSDTTRRLECFDRETAKVTPSAGNAVASTNVSPSHGASPVEVASAAPPPQDRQRQFGFSEQALTQREERSGARPPEMQEITARLAQVSGAADGHLLFTLDNQQVWRQIGAREELLAKPGDAVIISRGWLNSYNLVLGNRRGCKVQRVQ